MKAQLDDTNAEAALNDLAQRFAAVPTRIRQGSSYDGLTRAAGDGGLRDELASMCRATDSYCAPTDIECRLKLGVVFYSCGDDANAIQSFNDVISEQESHVEAWFNLGVVIFGQGQFAEAEYCFSRACEIDPSDAQAWNKRGACLWKLDQRRESRRCVQRARALDRGSLHPRVNLQRLA